MSNAVKSIPAVDSQAELYRSVRDFTQRIVAPLSTEDCMVQSMDDVSPTRWHIAHTTWFFETFVLKPNGNYKEYDPQFNYLFNSYYNAVGSQFPRPKRGLISRPGLQRIKEYRQHIDEQMIRMLRSGNCSDETRRVIEVGLHHEQQHQELMLTDIKHVLSCNPTMPKYRDTPFAECGRNSEDWFVVDEGIFPIGKNGDGFSFDNESPQHHIFQNEFRLSNNLVTCRQYLEFMNDRGYQRPELWLSLGWSTANQNMWSAPMYWVEQDGQWSQFTLAGLRPVNPDWPVSHISYFEADAFARWSGNRLPTEFEWEIAIKNTPQSSTPLQESQFADRLFENNQTIHPTCSTHGLMGGVWQWTSSSYGAYPGYRPADGAIGEYNGKFMCNQYVLRGGSVATSSNHVRPTYRNFFPPDSRWQFAGIRLAR